jgi:TonB family protein
MPKLWNCLIILVLLLASCSSKVTNSFVAEVIETIDNSETPPFLRSCAALINTDAQVVCSNQTILDYIQSDMDYPLSAKKIGLQGTVIISDVTNQYGNVTDVKLEQGIATMLNNEALNLIQSLPKFVPTTKNKIPKPCRGNFPVEFNLED